VDKSVVFELPSRRRIHSFLAVLVPSSEEFKMFSVFLMALVVAISTPASAASKGASLKEHLHAAPHPSPSPAYALLDIALEATAREHLRNGARPTVGSRMLGIVVTSMYDAWAAYDGKAAGTRLGDRLRRPLSERTLENKKKALAFAVLRSLLYNFPEDKIWIEGRFKEYGIDPADVSENPATPQGIGNLAAGAVIAYRRNDGSNQHMDEAGTGAKPFSDYTYYAPVNSPNKIIDPDKWQQIPFLDAQGKTFYPGFLTPHWYRVKPFGLKSSDQFRAPPPPLIGSEQIKQETEECVRYNGSLTLEQKAVVEFMRDGPKSTGQSGHWLRFAQDLSRRDQYGIDQDVKLFFVVGNVAMDAFIAAWETKRYYNTSRPWTLIRHYYAGQKIVGWKGPGKGVATTPAEQWIPYSPAVFPTPPFPGYVSGHSTVSAACAKTLELFSGNDHFGFKERRKAGALTEPNLTGPVIQQVEGKSSDKSPDSTDVVLNLPTFTATAEMAGISRIMGGYHIQADNVAGLEMGRKVAQFLWPIFQTYFNGTAGKSAVVQEGG
jgi:PAP2 superfamily